MKISVDVLRKSLARTLTETQEPIEIIRRGVVLGTFYPLHIRLPAKIQVEVSDIQRGPSSKPTATEATMTIPETIDVETLNIKPGNIYCPDMCKCGRFEAESDGTCMRCKRG